VGRRRPRRTSWCRAKSTAGVLGFLVERRTAGVDVEAAAATIRLGRRVVLSGGRSGTTGCWPEMDRARGGSRMAVARATVGRARCSPGDRAGAGADCGVRHEEPGGFGSPNRLVQAGRSGWPTPCGVDAGTRHCGRPMAACFRFCRGERGGHGQVRGAETAGHRVRHTAVHWPRRDGAGWGRRDHPVHRYSWRPSGMSSHGGRHASTPGTVIVLQAKL